MLLIYTLIQIPNAFSLSVIKWLEIIFVFKNKGHYKINYNRTSESEERQVNKIHPHCGGFNTQFFSPPLAHAKGLMFKPKNYPADHYTNILNLNLILKYTGGNGAAQTFLMNTIMII